jgi:hypothetical protein
MNPIEEGKKKHFLMQTNKKSMNLLKKKKS